MAWGTKQSATQLTAITTELFFDETPQLGIGDQCRCQVEINFQATPTEYALISVYSTLDDTPGQWDVLPISRFELTYDTDPNVISFTIPWHVYKFRIGIQRSGTTDTLTSADFSYRVGSP